MPMVRAETFKILPDLITVADQKFYKKYLKDLLQLISQEVPSSYRLLLVKIVLKLAQNMHRIQVDLPDILGRIDTASKDSSWCTRNEVVTNLPDLCLALSKINTNQKIEDSMCPLIIKFMGDKESKVKENMAKQLPKCLKVLNCKTYSTKIISKFFELSKDLDEKIRTECAKIFVEVFQNGEFPVKKLQELLISFKEMELPIVEEHICHNFSKIIKFLGKEHWEVCEKYASKWKENTRWRVRNALLSNVGEIAKLYGSDRFQKSIFRTILSESLTDKAYQVRIEACDQIEKLCTLNITFMRKFISNTFLPEILKHQTEKGYLKRAVVMTALEKIAPHADLELLPKK
eukprot:UN25318